MVLRFFRAFIARVEGPFRTKTDLATARLHVNVLFPERMPLFKKSFFNETFLPGEVVKLLQTKGEIMLVQA